ncbi:MAG: response regulator [Candidatus Cloacimonetes bacterium]|nr:response regulator [Candidatus Cloacimonadota bacterium]
MGLKSEKDATRVLIVEDEMIIAQDIARISENCGYQVLDIVSSGEVAVPTAIQLNPDVVLMDIMLGDEMTGLVAAEEIHYALDIPIVFITAFADDKTINKSKMAEPFGYIIKPFDERELKAVIELAIYKHAMQQILKRSEAKYRRIFENIQDVFCEMELDGTIIEISPSIEAMSNHKRSDLLGSNIGDLITDKQQVTDLLNMNKNNNSIRDLEIKINNNDNVIYYSVISQLLSDANDGSNKIIASLHDITEHKLLEKRLMRAERLAGVGQLAAGIAHEIRNPLGNISSSIQYCLKKYELPTQIVQYLEIILRNSQNANKIIKELLDFATPREIELKTENISDIIKRSIDLVEARVKQNKVKIDLSIDMDLPKINLDAKWIEQTFLNLILNANDAMKGGGVLKIKAALNNENINVTFEDNGQGIPSDEIEKIFDPFYTTKDEGTGLGLSFIFQVITAHNGDVDVESRVGEGAKFTIKLPINT